MQKYRIGFFISILFLVNYSYLKSQSFNGGNLAVMYIGDGTTATLGSSSYQEYVLEITPTGSVVQFVTIPNGTSGSGCTSSGSATSDADLNTSGDGKLITFGGYDAPVGTASVVTTANINRNICKINNAGSITFPSSFSGNNASSTALYVTDNFRSVITNDGTGFWCAGQGTKGGVDYIPSGTVNATTASAGVARLNTGLSNVRVVKIIKNQLYANASSGSFKDPFSIGSGLPTSGTPTYAVLGGLTNNHDGYSFVIFDRNGDGTLDLMYVADFTSGLLKYYFNGTIWVAAGSLTGPNGVVGLTGYLDCNYNPILFATTGSTGASNNKVYSYTDASSNSTSLSGTLAATCTTILTAGNGYVFKGIALVPTQGDISLASGTLTLSGSYRSITLTGGTTTLSGTNVYASDSIYVGSGATLICGTTFLKGRKFILAAGGTLKIASPNGITASAASGNIQTTCRNYNTSGNYEYNGTAAQVTGNGLPSIVNDLTINNSTGVTLTSSSTVNGIATFNSGILTTTATNLLAIASSGSVVGGAAANYVNGPLRKIGNSSFVFPIGKGGQFAPITISAPSLLTDHFTAEYFYTNPDPTYDKTLKDATIDHISACEYWMLNRTNGTSNVTVGLSWDTPRSCGVTSLSDLIIAHWDSNLATPIWKDMGNGGTTGSTSSGTISTLSTVSSFSPFTLGSINSLNPLPIELITFSASSKDNTSVNLYWQTSSEQNNDFFTLEKSDDGTHFKTLDIIDAAGTSSQIINYSRIDNFPFKDITYYRLKQTDFNGESSFSSIVSVKLTENFYVQSIFPNPATDYLHLEFNQTPDTELEIEVLNNLGQIVYKNSNTIASEFSLDISKFSTGIYLIRVTSDNYNYQTKFLKQ